MDSADVVVVGSGAGGLVAALVAADRGFSVVVYEKSPLIGGTTAISGGGIWVPDNPVMKRSGYDDSVEAGLQYLERLTLGATPSEALKALVSDGSDMLSWLEDNTDLKFFAVPRPDYHPDFAGAAFGRSVEPEAFRVDLPDELAGIVRVSPFRAPVTSVEARNGLSADIIEQRKQEGWGAQGAGLVAGLVQACHARGVKFRVSSPISRLHTDGDRVAGVWTDNGLQSANVAVVLASGGFEWNEDMVSAYLANPEVFPTTPPGNTGDGLRMGVLAGGRLSNMTEAWWTAAVQVPGECLDGVPYTRNVVGELAKPGSIMVNRAGKRFVNEASSYNDLGMTFNAFDVGTWSFANLPAWLIFDQAFKNKYAVAAVPPSQPAPDWFLKADTLDELAALAKVDRDGLLDTVSRNNQFSTTGVDEDFGRGADIHGQYYGDETNAPNVCLGPISEAPFYAVRVVAGSNGTKGGLTTDRHARVLRHNHTPIEGLYACGNVSASILGKGYAGHGSSLGPIMTAAYKCGRSLER